MRAWLHSLTQRSIRAKGWIENVTTLTLAQLRSATSGDDYWSGLSWDELSRSEKEAWGALVWDQEYWDEGLEPATADTPWEELTEEQRRRLRSLGYDQETWDG